MSVKKALKGYIVVVDDAPLDPGPPPSGPSGSYNAPASKSCSDKSNVCCQTCGKLWHARVSDDKRERMQSRIEAWFHELIPEDGELAPEKSEAKRLVEALCRILDE